MDIKKIISIIAVVLLFANFMLFAFGEINAFLFWIFLISIAVTAFSIQKILRNVYKPKKAK